MRKLNTAWLGTILVVFTLATATYLTFFSTVHTGLEIEADQREQGGNLHDVPVPEDMKALTDLFRTINLVQKRYLDPTRIDPKAMFVSSLRAIELHVAQMLVQEKDDILSVRLGTDERRFILSDLTTPWVLLQRMKEIFDFLASEIEKEKIDLPEVEYNAINGMLRTLDPHSVFLNANQYREMQDKTQGNFAGLGIVISIRDGVLTIIAPMSGTPADLAGLEAGDQIAKIDEESTVNMSLNDAVDLLRGEPGTKVTVYILRKGWAEPKPFSIARAIIKVESLESHMLNGGVGYIKIKDFQGNTAADVKSVLTSWRKSYLSGLVLDLRGCPGGLLEAAVQVSDLFLSNGVIVTTAGQGAGERDVRRATPDGDEPNYPLVVLVDRGSASASEILAGALKNNNRALLIGERTFGKGSVQVLFEFQDDTAKKQTTALKLTTAQYLTPGDISIQSFGVVPQVEVLPMRADEEMIDLSIEDGYRESDLDQHFEVANATREADGARATLNYLWTPPKNSGKAGDEPDAGMPRPIEKDQPFEPDYIIDLGKDLVARMARSKETRMASDILSKLLEQKRQVEEKRLVGALKKLGVDWRSGDEAPDPMTFSVEEHIGRDEVLNAGEDVELKLKVTNNGARTFFRLGASSYSDFRPLNDRELAFGSVGPGESITRTLKFRVPKDSFAQVSDVRWSFYVEHGPSPEPTALRFTVVPLPRPQFSYRYTLDDTANGNGDGKLQPGESITVKLDIQNVGEGESLNTFATLKSLSQKELFMTRGRESLARMKPKEQKTGTFAFEIRPGFNEKEARFELAIADVDLRVYLVENLVIPVVPADVRGSSVDSRKIAPQVTRRLTAPPVIAIDPINPSTRSDTIKLHGKIVDETNIRDMYIFVGDEKLFFKSNRDNPHPQTLDFETTLPLKNGINFITVVAEETADLENRQILAIRRDRADGMPYLQSRLPNGKPELLGVIPANTPSHQVPAGSGHGRVSPLAQMPQGDSDQVVAPSALGGEGEQIHSGAVSR